MKHSRRRLRPVAPLLLLIGAAASVAHGQVAASQPESQPTSTEPASQPTTAPVNVLRSQASMYAYFTAALARGEEGRVDALRCLDSSQVDPEKWKAESLEYLNKLAAILERLRTEGLFDPQTLSDDPAADPVAIGRDPVLLLLSRQQIGDEGDELTRGRMVWRFSAQTVADIPRIHEKLDELIAAAQDDAAPQPAIEESTPPQAAEQVDPLRSPYHMVQHFVVHAQGAANDPSNYVEAMRCLDFSLLDEQEVQKNGPQYVDQLWSLLRFLRERGRFDRDALPKDLPADLDQIPFDDAEAKVSVVIARRGAQWRFASSTVAKLPEMVEAMRAVGEAPPPAVAVPLDTSTPAGTLNLFFTAMSEHDLRTAVTCLDLSELRDRDPSVTWPIAGKIKLVLDRERLIVASEIETPPNDAPVVLVKEIHGRVELVKQTEGPRKGEWLFSAATVRQIDALYEAW
ncbi:MAG: hypothetical protein D6744_16160, partial [Planctomycetota bacterium]